MPDALGWCCCAVNHRVILGCWIFNSSVFFGRHVMLEKVTSTKRSHKQRTFCAAYVVTGGGDHEGRTRERERLAAATC